MYDKQFKATNENTKGNCYICGVNLDSTEMKEHIIEFHKGDENDQECLLLKVEGAYDNGYWLYIDVHMEKTLKSLDTFLRNVWLECCGHLSEFYECDHFPKYSTQGRFPIKNSRKMKTFAAGDRFFHIYDYGSTTEIAITVIGKTWRKPQRSIVRVIARNTPFVYKCDDCGKKAFYLCEVFIEPFESQFYCFECSEKHEDDEHYLHRVTNSPRMGICAYDGYYDTFEFNQKLEPIAKPRTFGSD